MRRLALVPLPYRALLLATVGAALFGVWQGAQALAEGAAGAADPARAVRDHLFWLNVLQRFVFAYTTFEVLFRASDAAFLGTLPFDGGRRYRTLLLRALLWHLPLAVPVWAYAAALSRAGLDGSLAALDGALAYASGVPICAAIHVAAGRSLCRDPTRLRRMLAGGVVPEDVAMLLYSPAAGLGTCLGIGMLTEVLEAKGAILASIALALGAAAFATWHAQRTARAELGAIAARFGEAEIPPPYREDGLPARTPGAWLVRLLPISWRATFLRDLRQLRRRHRLDRVLVAIFAVVTSWLNLRDGSGMGVLENLALSWSYGFLFLTSAFRLRGPELGSLWLDTIPAGSLPAAAGRMAADALAPLEVVVLGSLAAGLGAGPGVALQVLAPGILGVALALGVTHALAALAGRDRAFWMAAAWRGAVVFGAGVLVWRR
jgi:hypothetical protein